MVVRGCVREVCRRLARPSVAVSSGGGGGGGETDPRFTLQPQDVVVGVGEDAEITFAVAGTEPITVDLWGYY